MKCIALIGLIVLAVSVADAAARNRAKRFAGFGAISTVGGRVGCVVSENGPGNYSLYINSHFTKFLNPEEQNELEEYKTQLMHYKDNIKTYIEERRKAAFSQQEAQRSAFAQRALPGQQLPLSTQESTTVSGSEKQPEAPKKPSFCSEKAVTQYVFDGCSVQGDSVFIGDNFVRKLTPAEQERLVQFDQEFTAYQDSVRQVRLQQMEQIFGKQFGALFEASGLTSKSTEGDHSSSAVRQKTKKETGVHLNVPKAPEFCTLII